MQLVSVADVFGKQINNVLFLFCILDYILLYDQICCGNIHQNTSQYVSDFLCSFDRMFLVCVQTGER